MLRADESMGRETEEGSADGGETVNGQEAPVVSGYEVRRLTADDADEITALYVRCTAFVELVEGRPPTPREGHELLAARPPEVAAEDKLTFGLFDQGALIGALDVLRGYPEPRTWYLGLLMLAPEARSRGLGATVYEAVRAWVAANGGDAIRLAVQAQNNAAQRFWERQGFVVIGAATQATGSRENEVFRMEHRFTPMTIAEIVDGDVEAVIALWDACELTRPWNDVHADIALARRTATSTILVGKEDGRVVATAMAGSDGHRGWLYYVAASPDLQRKGRGRAIMTAAEAFLRAQGVPKIELMVRSENLKARGFYDRLGYSVEDVVVMSRRLRSA